MTVRCDSCRHWMKLQADLGSCALAASRAGVPNNTKSLAVATASREDALLLTHRTFLCTQFQRGTTNGEITRLPPHNGGQAKDGELFKRPVETPG